MARTLEHRNLRARLAALLRDQKGSTALEFAFMLAMTIIAMMVILSISTLGTQMLTTRYASFTAARGYLCRDPLWMDGARQVGSLVLQNTGQVSATPSGGGVTVRVEVKEVFPYPTILGSGGRAWLERESNLGPQEPMMGGDNVAFGSPGP